jgi:hypothetical protein
MNRTTYAQDAVFYTKHAPCAAHIEGNHMQTGARAARRMKRAACVCVCVCVCICSVCPRTMQHIHTTDTTTHTPRTQPCEARGVRISDPRRSRCRLLSYSREYQQCACMMHICIYVYMGDGFFLRLRRHQRGRLRARVCVYMCASVLFTAFCSPMRYRVHKP